MLRLPAAAALLLALAWPVPASAGGEVLGQIFSRGSVRCGVSEGIAGFSAKEPTGRWTGLDADFCRAMAAAVLGDAEKVTFVPLRASARFVALKAGSIDLLASNATWNLSREASLRVAFAGVLFYDGQGFLVPRAGGVTSVAKLDGAAVCVEKGTTHQRNLVDYFAARGLRVEPVVVDSGLEVATAFFAGRCRAYTSDTAQLAAVRLQAPAGSPVVMLRERISKEPLAPAVRQGDDDWLTLVRWVLFALVTAEENGVTREKVIATDERTRTAAAEALSVDARVEAALGIAPGWAIRAVAAVGNYGEMFDRSLGDGSRLKLERGLNRLWTNGGLMYAPPLR